MMYTSKYAELRLIMKPSNRMLDDKGRVVALPGTKVEFNGFKYMTTDQDTIDWLHNHHLRGIMFDEVREDEVEAIQKKVAAAQTQIANGATSTINNPAAGIGSGESILSRPEDKIMLNADLAEVIKREINEQIREALSEIKALLQKDTTREKEIKENIPRKTFKCPYCKEEFSSGFKVGKHKPECAKKPQAKKS
jgi:hypothetical protein